MLNESQSHRPGRVRQKGGVGLIKEVGTTPAGRSVSVSAKVANADGQGQIAYLVDRVTCETSFLGPVDTKDLQRREQCERFEVEPISFHLR